MIRPQRIVVVAPHPDDETLGAGGAIARYAAEGAKVFIDMTLPGAWRPGSNLSHLGGVDLSVSGD